LSITETFAGVAVAELGPVQRWYELLFGREPDLIPNEREAAWQLSEGGWIYLVEDAERAGRSLITLLVDDLDAELAAIGGRGIEPESRETIPGAVRKAELTDPAGNLVTLGQPL
jgi:hypothetical protein